MPYGLYVLIGLSVFSAGVLIWVCRARGSGFGPPSYQALLAEKARLNDCVTHWKYADGSIVPQHKRLRMFRELHRVSHQIHQHPEHSCETRGHTKPAVHDDVFKNRGQNGNPTVF